MKSSLNIQENVPLAPLTTLKIGGNARYFIRAETEQQVIDGVKFAFENDLKLFIFGGGSNVLISDKGFDGVVLQIAIEGIETNESSSQLITVGAGEDWDGFVKYCVDHDFAGVECLSGIPGFVGGTPVQNVGAYGQEVAEAILAVRCFDRVGMEPITLSNTECGFSYRTSIFNSTHRERFIVLGVTFQLAINGEPKTVYKDLAERFADRNPTLSEVREAVLEIRRSKSMVIDPADPNSKSAGSFFKNPIVSKEKLDEIRALYARAPSFKYGDMYKVPAAWLIENSGFHKGFTLSNAGISANHSLALINRGNATASDILALKERIQEGVGRTFGIDLISEPIFVEF